MPMLAPVTTLRVLPLAWVVTLAAATAIGLAACGTGQPGPRTARGHATTSASAAAASTGARPAGASSTGASSPAAPTSDGSPSPASPATSVAASTSGAAPVDTGIKVYGDCLTPSVEPSEIVLTCADGNEVLTGLRWDSWTATEATAVGTLEYNDCDPYCAAGHIHAVPDTRVTLTVPVTSGDGQLVWSQVRESPEPPGYRSGPYGGRPQPLPTRAD